MDYLDRLDEILLVGKVTQVLLVTGVLMVVLEPKEEQVNYNM